MAPQKQIILITGASSGIGLVTTASLISTPTNHVIMGVRNLAKGEKCLKDLQSQRPQGTLSLLELDVTNDDSISAAINQISMDFGRIDSLINNAGIAEGGKHPTRAELRNLFEINVFGPTILTNSLIPLLQNSPAPKVINVSSERGSIHNCANPAESKYGDGGLPAYRVTKAALNMLTVTQYKELKSFGCKVWCYCPGFVISNLGGAELQPMRKQMGAEDPQTSADGIVEILQGKRDSEVGMFIGRAGEQIRW
ncbi:short chain dehydrogenase [Periconia macrospinosa]|uniref:Short chain dehydrogenase n=1 Tax=Periconia macrospinosa TaxID=97972 RepID=A0A2V1DSQ4_9PLEO|nr:short chain dehydrogenase [Periconia macrospinosa]